MGKSIALAKAPTDIFDAEEDRKLQERARAESGPVKTTLDLNSFIVFGPGYRKSTGKWLSIDSRGGIRISHDVCQQIQSECIEFRMNIAGTIVAFRPIESGGLKLRPGRASQASCTTCRAAKRHLEERGITIPARYELEWNDELQVWVGRLLK